MIPSTTFAALPSAISDEAVTLAFPAILPGPAKTKKLLLTGAIMPGVTNIRRMIWMMLFQL